VFVWSRGHGVTEPAPTAEDAVASYAALLRRYHGTLDLMSDRALERLDDFLDDARAYARAVAEFAPSGTVLDLGTGAGLPAAVVAAYLRGRTMLWVERRRRRATFLRSVAAQCGFGHVAVVGRDVRRVTRAELPEPLAAVTAQAVGDLAMLYRLTAHLHDSEVTLIARRAEDRTDDWRALAECLSSDVLVLGQWPLGGGGTLVAVRAPGGRPCP
jgi:16S rRNA (guanine527-N7)-methyltransferase